MEGFSKAGEYPAGLRRCMWQPGSRRIRDDKLFVHFIGDDIRVAPRAWVFSPAFPGLELRACRLVISTVPDTLEKVSLAP